MLPIIVFNYMLIYTINLIFHTIIFYLCLNYSSIFKILDSIIQYIYFVLVIIYNKLSYLNKMLKIHYIHRVIAIIIITIIIAILF